MYKKASLLLLFLLISVSGHAQWPFGKKGGDKDNSDRLKLYQNSRGLLLGYERGRLDMLQAGYHYNWKKIKLVKPIIRATEAYIEYAPFQNVLGARAAYWQRLGRFKFTYGGHVGAFTDFSESSLSIGPSVGFRLVGIHAQLGANLHSNPEIDANHLYVSISIFLPQHTSLSSKKGEKEKSILKW